MTLEPITQEQLRRQREIAQRKKKQAAISRASAALGLGGLATVAASGIAGKKPRLLGIKPKNANASRKKLKDVGIYTSVGSTGVGSASSLYFAGTQGKEAALENKVTNTQQRMNNQHAIKKTLGEISKARRSTAVPRESEAWRMADRGRDDMWRNYVSGSALQGYEANAAGRRRHAQGNMMMAGGVAGQMTGLGLMARGFSSPKAIGVIPGAASMIGGSTLGLLGIKRRESGKGAVMRSHKIKARGFQRMIDERDSVNKVWRGPTLARVPGTMRLVLRNPSYSRPRIVRRTI